VAGSCCSSTGSRRKPGARFDTCYALLDESDDIDALHAAFRAGLKATYGRVPARGIPRIGAVHDMSYGVRQFLMTDPAGNQLRVGKAEVTATPLTDDERSALTDHLTRAADLAGSLETTGA
jgi:hypothetical protein